MDDDEPAAQYHPLAHAAVGADRPGEPQYLPASHATGAATPPGQ
jgi:hypothetical protein